MPYTSMKREIESEIINISIPPAINIDGSLRPKKDKYDYGLTESDAETYEHWEQYETAERLQKYYGQKIKIR